MIQGFDTLSEETVLTDDFHGFCIPLTKVDLSADIRIMYDSDRACDSHGREEKFVQDFCGKARRKETTRKTKA
jgi:hypothetical protein